MAPPPTRMAGVTVLRAALLAMLISLVLAGCTGGGGGGEGEGEGDGAPSSTAAADPTPTPATEPPASPEVGACYRLRFRSALAPTSQARPRPCAQPHTSQTYAVGALDTVVDGHLLAVDARRVQQDVADTCPEELAGFVGGSEDDLRLSMIRPVWFTPTVEESDAGADWYRCDVVVVEGAASLVERTGTLEGALDRPADAEAVAMCGTAAPDADDFTRVPCGAEHSWRALAVVDFPAGDYPGVAAAQERGQAQCEDVASERAEDPLDFEWGYEWPTKEQWSTGQTYGRCWAPD